MRIQRSKIKKIKNCGVEGCNRKYSAKGFCKKHYEQFRVYGSAGHKLPVGCKVEYCSESYFAKGYCRTHYYRMRNRGSTDPHPKFVKKLCSVDGCVNLQSAKGYCQSHWRRIRLYGTTDPRPKKVCSVEGCGRPHEGNGYCGIHGYRFKKYGSVELPPKAEPARTINGSGYYIFRDRMTKKIKYEHVRIAEKALGRPLPSGAEVHHVDGNRANNDPRNLVICPSQAYHSLIEVRTKAYNKKIVPR